MENVPLAWVGAIAIMLVFYVPASRKFAQFMDGSDLVPTREFLVAVTLPGVAALALAACITIKTLIGF